jgi:pimeloyl-ACP methyl ester carboxylesterase
MNSPLFVGKRSVLLGSRIRKDAKTTPRNRIFPGLAPFSAHPRGEFSKTLTKTDTRLSAPQHDPSAARQSKMKQTLRCLFLAICSFLPGVTAVAGDLGVVEPSFDSHGVPIHYLVTGSAEGEPVVLIHGFAGNIELQWTAVIDALKKDYRVIALDCRGHGRSGKPHDPASYGVEMANDVARLLDHLKIEKAHIVGYSMGSGIALGFAVHYPQRALTVTLGGTGLSHDQDDLILGVAEALEKHGSLGPLLAGLTPKGRQTPSPETVKFIDHAVLAVNDPKALAAVARGAVAAKITDEEATALVPPVLAIIGSDDPLRSGVDRLKELHPATKVVVIDKADHMTAAYRPEFITALRQFLEDHRQPASQ